MADGGGGGGGGAPPPPPPGPPAPPDPAALALTQLRDLLARLGLDVNQRDALTQTHGIVSVNDLVLLTAKDTRDTCKDLASRTVADGRVNFGIVRIKRLQAPCNWCRDEINQRGTMDPARFTPAELNEAIERFNTTDEKDDESPDRPATLVVSKWPAEKERMTNYLFMLRNIDNAPLSCVIRPEPDPGAPVPTESLQLLVSTTRHAGAVWTNDNQRVCGILKAWVLGTDACEHIRSIDNSRNGREAWLALAVCYDGEGFAERILDAAEAKLNSLHCISESRPSFDKHVTQMKACFAALNTKSNGTRVITDKQQVTRFLNQIKSNADELKTQVALCRHAHGEDFDAASNCLATQVSRIKALQRTNANRNRLTSGAEADSRSISSTSGRGRGSGGRGGGRSSQGGRGGRGGSRAHGGHGRGGRGRRSFMAQGYDLSDPPASAPQDVYQAMPLWLRNAIDQQRHPERWTQAQFVGNSGGRGQDRQSQISATNQRQQLPSGDAGHCGPTNTNEQPQRRPAWAHARPLGP